MQNNLDFVEICKKISCHVIVSVQGMWCCIKVGAGDCVYCNRKLSLFQ